MGNSTTGFFGLRPVRRRDGSPYNGAVEKCFVSSSDTVAIYIGDPVAMAVADANMDSLGLHTSVMHTAGADAAVIYGVVCSVFPSTASSLPYRAASTERYVGVCPVENMIFQIKGDGGGTPANEWLGLNAVMIAGTDSTITGMSGAALDEGSADGPAEDQSNPLVILGVANLPDNELGDYAIWEVMINTPEIAATGGLYLGVAAS